MRGHVDRVGVASLRGDAPTRHGRPRARDRPPKCVGRRRSHRSARSRGAGRRALPARPSHRIVERLLRRRRAGTPPLVLRLPHRPGQELARHRLQLHGRPLRWRLGGPSRIDQLADQGFGHRRQSGVRPVVLPGRQSRRGATHARGGRIARPVAGLARRHLRHRDRTRRDHHLRVSRIEPMARRFDRHDPDHQRSSRHVLDHLSG